MKDGKRVWLWRGSDVGKMEEEKFVFRAQLANLLKAV